MPKPSTAGSSSSPDGQAAPPAVGTRVARAVLQRLAKTRLARRALVVALRDDENLGWVVYHLSDRLAIREASWEADCPPGLEEIGGFEDLHWLYTSSPITHRLSRLQLDESAYLYRLVRALDGPRVAEIGRFKGGTTFLLAAAGASVLSIDVAREAQARYDPPLEGALERFGLRDRAELVIGDSRVHEVSRESLDVAFLDAGISYDAYDAARADVEHWLPALVPGGHLVLHTIDRNAPSYRFLQARMTGLFRLTAELDEDDRLQGRPEAPPSLAHYVKT